MRGLSFAFIALAAGLVAGVAGAAGAPDDKIGARTTSPEQMLSEFGSGVSDAELERAAAEAATHPFGTRDNPARVGGPEGERTYISRLHCGDGSRPRVGPRRDGGIGAYGTVTGLYPLDCGNAAPGRFDLVIDMYHEEHKEDQAPAGFRIDPSH
jgi:hypothetical protein